MVGHKTLPQSALNIRRSAFRVQCSRGFSLIELLVVIGLMGLLLLILLPALAAAKKQARIVETTSELQAIASACEGYKGMFNAYPGPISEPDVAQTDSTTKNFSGTQNLLLGLLGGIQASGGTSISITPYSGSGYTLHANFQASGVTDWSNGGRTVNAFYIPRQGEVRAVPQTSSGFPGSTNPNPTLMDHYPDALPILYYRRDTSKIGLSSPQQYCVLGLYGNAGGAAYLRGANVEYTNSTTLKATSGLLCDQSQSGLTYTVYNNTAVSSSDWGNADWGLVAIKWNGSCWPGSSILQHNPPGGFLLVAADPNRFYAYPNSIVLFGGEQ